MALIEHLERDDWQSLLRRFFEYTLEVLKVDRFRMVGSAVDDLRAWLARGGVSRVREVLSDQMEMRRFTPERKAAVFAFVDQLVQENRRQILDLTAAGIVPGPPAHSFSVCGLSESEIQDLWSRLISGERPFEDWMHAHGHSDEEIRAVYRVIDAWLMQRGLVPPGPERG
ncbi:MAG: hypothetical protein HY721_06385 [Planctomycetes bacterium]|nr:hypothetical protein [Planctomycetota bacterium]